MHSLLLSRAANCLAVHGHSHVLAAPKSRCLCYFHCYIAFILRWEPC